MNYPTNSPRWLDSDTEDNTGPDANDCSEDVDHIENSDKQTKTIIKATIIEDNNKKMHEKNAWNITKQIKLRKGYHNLEKSL